MSAPHQPDDEVTPRVHPPESASEAPTVSHEAEPAQEQRPGVAMPVAPGQLLAGRYTVLEQLGQGGMGVVLAAYDARLDRRVALKLLLPQPGNREEQPARARLLREAQAMARLSHPNVVAVYDAGSLEDGHIFIAMEMVDGQTLRRWSKAQPRSWHEVLEAFLAAGRGLAAAHAAGLVHRDFKPENVLVGRDGRVRVTDFGVVRAEPTSGLDSEPTPPSTPPSVHWMTSLTRPGSVPGTPRYLAPELLTGAPADVRSDVFAFCVSLYEALFLQYPFPGSTVRERLLAMSQGRLAPLPTRSEVPAWLVDVLQRGLSADPGQRPPSMEALLLALSRSPAGVRARWLSLAASLVVGLGLATSAGVAWRVHATERAQLCQGASLRLAGVWDASIRTRLGEAFTATGTPYAEGTFATVRKALDEYAHQWALQHREACEATRLRGEQSEELLTRRMSCLDRRLQELEAFGLVLAQADATVVQKAAQAAQNLPSPQLCADTEALLAEVPLPETPERRRAVEELRRELAHVQALTLGGRLKDAATTATTAVARARSLDYAPVLAEALLLQGRALASFKPQEAVQALSEAVWKANACAQDRLAATAGLQLARQLAIGRRHEDLRWWRDYLPSVLERLHGAPELEAELHAALAIDFTYQGQYDNAVTSSERARKLLTQVLGPAHYRTLQVEHNAALARKGAGQYVLATQLMEQALPRLEQAMGRQHPFTAYASLNLASLYKTLGRNQDSSARLELARDVLLQNVPEVSMDFATWHDISAGLALDWGRYSQGRDHARAALSILERMGQQRSLHAASAMQDLGMALIYLERPREALEVLQRSLRLLEELVGPKDQAVAEAMRILAFWHSKQQRFAEALRLHEQSLRLVLEKEEERGPLARVARLFRARAWLDVGRSAEALEEARELHPLLVESTGEGSPLVVESLSLQGEALLALDRPAEARPLLERAALHARLAEMDPNQRALLHFLLARALAGPPSAAEQVQAQVAQSHAALARSELPDERLRAALERWVRRL